MKRIPKRLQSILWSKNIHNLNLGHDQVYIIHQILAYGEIYDIKWLFSIYPYNTIKDIFLHKPKRIYSKPVLNLVKNFILKLNHIDIDEKKYTKTTFQSFES